MTQFSMASLLEYYLYERRTPYLVTSTHPEPKTDLIFSTKKKKSLKKWAELEDMEEFTLSFRENNLYA